MGTKGRHGRMAAVAGVALVVAAAGCATEADPAALDDVVTEGESAGAENASLLAEAGERSAGEAYRVSVTMSMSMSGMDDGAGESFGFEGQVLTGAQDGDAYELHLDMNEAMADMGLDAQEELPPEGLSMDMVGDTETLYVTAPIFAEMNGMEDEALTEDWMGELAELGDRWGRVDLTALGDMAMGDVQRSLTGPGMGDPREMLDLLGDAGDTEDLGTDVIDGAEVRGTRFTVSFSDLTGRDLAALPDDTEGGGPDEGMAALADELLGDVPFEAWVDGDGYIRRLSYEIDMGDAVGDMAELADEGPPEGFTMVMGATIDFSDYGDPGIEIVFPDEADTVDITDAFRRMTEGD